MSEFNPYYNLQTQHAPEEEPQAPQDAYSLLSQEFRDQFSLKNKKAQELTAKSEEKKGRMSGSDDLTNLLGSSAIQAFGGVADTAMTIGANVVREGAKATGLGDYYTEQDKQVASEFLDPYISTEAADKMAGYDRTEYAAQQAKVGEQVEQGNYGQALMEAAPIALETVTESLPYMAMLFGGSSINAVRQAGQVAAKEAALYTGSKATIKAAEKAAIKEAKAGLNIANKARNVIAENAGLMTVAADQTKNQAEEFKANNNGKEMSQLELARAFSINTLLNGLDRWAFKDIIGIKSPLKEMVKDVPKSGLGIIAGKVVNTARGMGEEAGQEYLQQWGEIVNENWGTDKAKELTDVWSKGANDEAITAAILGSVAGGSMAQVKNAAETVGDLNQLGNYKTEAKNLDKTLEAGFADAETKTKWASNLKGNIEKETATKQKLEKVQSEVDEIKSSDVSALAKVVGLQKVMLNANKELDSVLPDSDANVHIINFGTTAMNKTAQDLVNSQEFTNMLDQLGSKDKKTILKSIQDVKTVPDMVKVLGSIDKIYESKEISKISKDFKNTVKEEAERLNKSIAADISYKSSIDAMGQTIKTKESRKTKIEKSEAPKTTLDVSYESLAGLSKKDLKAKLSEFDNKTLTELYKTAKIKTKDANKAKQSNVALGSSSMMETIKETLRPAPGLKAANTIKSTIKDVNKGRAVAKSIYDPKAPLKDRLKTFVSDKMDTLKAFAKEAQTTSAEQVRAKIPQEERLNALRVVKEAANDLSKLDPKEIPMVEEAVEHFHKIGSISKENYAKYRAKFDDYLEGDILTKNDIKKKASDIKTQVSNKSADLLEKARTMTKEDVEKEATDTLNKLITATKGKMTDSEIKLMSYTVAKLDSLGKLSKEKATELLDKIPENEGTIDLVKSTANKLYNDFTGSKVNREYYYTKVKDAVEAPLTQEIIKDSKTGFNILIDKAIKAKESMKDTWKKSVKKHEDTNYLDLYRDIKEGRILKEAGVDFEQVDTPVDSDGKSFISPERQAKIDELCKD